MNLINEPWPWYIGGPAIAVVLFLLLFSEKKFGMSSNLRTLCAMAGAGKKTAFFNFDWRQYRWNLVVAIGAATGGFLAATYMSDGTVGAIHEDVVIQLNSMDIEGAGKDYMPDALFSAAAFSNPKTLALLALGGFLVGFGTRYAGGCTSGHAISGLSNLQLPSLIAVIGFFIGGLLMNHLLLPYLL
jgi:uncharacterized membrane protein YedE/YeeE